MINDPTIKKNHMVLFFSDKNNCNEIILESVSKLAESNFKSPSMHFKLC